MTRSVEDVRRALAAQLSAARARSDALFELLTADGLYARPIAERHRLIFYLGHLEAFDWNLVCREVLRQPSLNRSFEQLFAFGIDPIDGKLPTDVPEDWPEPGQVRAWGQQTREAVDAAVATAPLEGWLEDGWALRMALEHRLMHVETLGYLLQRLDIRFKVPGPRCEVVDVAAAGGPIAVPRGVAHLGLSRAVAPHWGWDNEYERHPVQVPAFTISRLPVSNGEWLDFLNAGGYRARELWDEVAWQWLQREQVSHPAFWRRREGQWRWQTMFDEVPLPLHWPVYVSHAEASAYAAWKGARLPTEPEWHRAALGDDDRAYPWGSQPPQAGVHGNFDHLRFDPVASGSNPRGDSVFGVADLTGNGWEWTSTVFAPFEGFEPLPFYRGYSANFFDGRHFVLKGASAATDGVFLRPSFRNWFQAHYQHVFAKFRLVTNGGDT